MKAGFPIVGVGASAGGLEAFAQLLKSLDVTTGMAFVLVQHLDPHHESLLGEILARATTMPVLVVDDGTIVEPNKVYVIPPNTRMTIAENRLRLTPRGKSEDGLYPIDHFFCSLAREQKDNAIGVILSGTGSDGAKGLSAIVAEGGLTFAQDKASAKFDGMPVAAAATGVDYILPPEGIASELAKIAHGMKERLAPIDEASTDFQAILKLLSTARSMDFSRYKTPTVQRRILRRMAMHQIAKIEDYLAYLRVHETEIDSLYEDILIKVTDFFRTPESFGALKAHVFPILLKREPPPASLRVWVPGCATGEEAYSIAICILEAMEEAAVSTKIEIFATDISETALATARAGYYDETRVQSVSAKRLKRFFVKEGRGYRVTSAIREPCIFAKQNVARDPPFSKLDLISCRNLLIYLTPVLQERVLSAFHFALNAGGFLALGSAETIGSSTELFEVADKAGKIFSRKHALRNSRAPDFALDVLAEKSSMGAIASGVRIDVATKNDVKSEADRAILTKYTPPGVVINDRMEVIQFRGDTTQYLMHPPGDVTTSLFKMCREGLLVELRTALQAAAESGEPVKKTAWIRTPNLDSIPITVDVIPFSVSPSAQHHFAILFGPRVASAGTSEELNADEITQCRRLERELSETKEYLNAIIDSEQAANEELKSASEEILSANEELQSTNEEMSTAKEEVQATNEELVTVNDELQCRFQELNSVNSDLTNLFEATNIPIVMITENLCVRRFTEASEKVLNLSDTDIGKSLSEIGPKLRIHGLDALAADVIKTLNTKEEEIQDSEGEWYSLRIRPYRTRDNKIDGAVIALRDITKEKEIEGRAKDAKDVAEAANLAKSDFLANMSHEIRTPLSAILGYSELLANPNQTKSDALRCTTRIQKNIEQLTELIDEILDISKIEAGKLEVERVQFPLLPELSEIFILLQDRAIARGLTFDVSFEGEIPETISACPMRLRQILVNIVGNALKFTTHGGVSVVVQLVRSTQGQSNNLLSFVIKDSGCGLSLDQQERLFRPFSQADSSVTRKYGGTGLGLVLARRLAEALGGDVQLTESKVGNGSTFTFRLDPGSLVGIPMLKGITAADLKTRKDAPQDLFIANQRLQDLRILLVEDGPDNQILMTHVLEASGATVVSAVNGVEALKMALDNHYDLVLMDMQMPILDGYEATRQLRAKGYLTPIVALTANAMRGERETCLTVGCVEYISKPVKANLLVDTVAKFAKKKDLVPSEASGRSELHNDPIVGPLVGQFVQNLPKRVAALRDAERRSDWRELSSLAHQLAGSSGGYGFSEMGKEAAKIEAQAKNHVHAGILAQSIARFGSLCDAAVRGYSAEH